MSTPGHPEGEFRRVQPEGTPVSRRAVPKAGTRAHPAKRLMTSARPPARASLAPVIHLLLQPLPYVHPGAAASNARHAS
jgi:hypothetical protein